MKDLDRQRLQSLLPTPSVSPEVEAKLAAASADALAELAGDPGEPWWRRRPCALALRGRVPAKRAAALLERASDPEDVAEVRCALLEALTGTPAVGGSIPLLAWLRAQEGQEQEHGMAEAILAARARLGDATVAAVLATLAYDPWSHRRAAGEAGLDGIVEAHGLEVVVRALGVADLEELAFAGRRPEDRLLGMRLAHREGLPIDAALADDDVTVARAAYERMIDGSGASDADLLARAAAGRAAAAACRGLERPKGAAAGCFWALCTLAKRGHDVRAWWHELGQPRVPYDGVPEDVRLAILREYLPGERQTDPRLLLEAACVELPTAPAEDAQLARAIEALFAAGLSPGTPSSAGELYQQGGGTYYAITTAEEGRVDLSTLGPFVRSEAAVPRARQALAEAGFRVVDDAVLAVRMTGLHVYFFGSRDPLIVDDLLFYWQD